MTWSYVWSRAADVRLGIEEPLWLLAVLALGWFLYWGRHRARWPALAAVLRSVAWIAAVAGLAGLHLRVPLPESPATIVALVDRSASIDEVGRRWQDQFLAELDRRRSPTDEIGVVVFAGEARVVRWPHAAPLSTPLVPAPNAWETNLAAALDAARGLLPAGREAKLVLLTDGNETRGDARSLLPALRAMGTVIHAAIPPRAEEAPTQVTQLFVPQVAPAWTILPVRGVVMHRGAAETAAVRLWVDDALVEASTMKLEPGTTPLNLLWHASDPGTHLVRLEVQPHSSGYSSTGASRDTQVSLTSPLRLLLVSARTNSPLAAVARAQQLELRRVTPEGLRAGAIEWEAYHLVILEEPTGKFPPRIWSELSQYVASGGGLVVVGGESTFGDARLKASGLAELLPVTFEVRRPPRPEREPLSLFLLIDRSNSMGYHIYDRMRRSDDESKLAYARRAALALIEQLRDTDRVGVLAFDSQMYEVAPLAPLAENRGLLEHNIARLQPGGGTDFYEALQRASAELSRQHARGGHIILLTDGDTNRSAIEHEPVLRRLEESGVSVTTIRIGDDTVNLEFLQSISNRTGGKFYHVRDASELPQLLLQDTSRTITQKPRGGSTFAVRAGRPSQVTQAIAWDSAPPLSGYAYTQLKPNAELWLRIDQADRSDPLLAAWNYGAGRVVVFTAAWSEGAEPWLAWPENSQFWAQLLRWTAREISPRDFAVGLEAEGAGAWQLWIESFAERGPAEVLGRLVLGEQVQEPRFSLAGKRKLIGRVQAVPGSKGELTLLVRWQGRSLEERRYSLYFPSAAGRARGEEVREPNRPLLEVLTQATGGRLDAKASDVVTRSQTGGQTAAKSLDWVLLPLAMFAFVGDVAARKLLRTRSR
ncbi:MAG: VWA domain-containing protein [Candidatus Binatia bacterium]|nr:VWA domain-containing protein [Candidatus Binatia bacterium]